VPAKNVILCRERIKVARIDVVGGGLAGAEAAWQIASRGEKVRLFEMRPGKNTPAHKTEFFGELVCSNSLGSEKVSTGGGLLKLELKKLNSMLLEVALENRVPAGNALAVDREKFPREVTRRLEKHPLVEICREEVKNIPGDTITILASGPLTSEPLAKSLQDLTGQESLYFFDAAAPLVYSDTINMEKAFKGSRYEETGGDYINCPMNEQEYREFYSELVKAEVSPLHGFEDNKLFAGCMPVENLAQKGFKTLAFGPLKPVGLKDREGNRPYAVVQLRRDNKEGTLYNMVGFQTRLKWPEQKRVFRMVPGLENAEFARYGVMHRNSFINSPKSLEPTQQLKARPNVFCAGQLIGVEGYLESALTGLWAGINAFLLSRGENLLVPPGQTAIGSLIDYITTPAKNFQPINMNFGLLPQPKKRIKKKEERREEQVRIAGETLERFIEDFKVINE